MSWFGWMLLSAVAMAGWLVVQTLFGWWGLVAGFLVGGLFCLGMAGSGARRVASDPSRRRTRCAECGTALPDGAPVCRRCGGLAPVPGAPPRPAPPGSTRRQETAPQRDDGGDSSLAGQLARATAPVYAQLGANYTWRNWAAALLIVGGVAGAIGASVVGWAAQAAALGAGVGGGLAVLRWMPPGD